MSERVSIGSRDLTVAVKTVGAELCSIRDSAGREYLWQAGPAWPRHAPILFPVVGRLHGDALAFGEARYPMGQHGFARDLRFDLLEDRAASCRFALSDSAATWDAYPFRFRLEVAVVVRGRTVTLRTAVDNPGETAMPFSVGAHPAFAWPLPGAGSRPAHRLEFEQDETACGRSCSRGER